MRSHVNEATVPQWDEVHSEDGLSANCVFLGGGATGCAERGGGCWRGTQLPRLCLQAAGELEDLMCSISGGGGCSKGSLCSIPVMNQVLVPFNKKCTSLNEGRLGGKRSPGGTPAADLSSLRLRKIKKAFFFSRSAPYVLVKTENMVFECTTSLKKKQTRLVSWCESVQCCLIRVALASRSHSLHFLLPAISIDVASPAFVGRLVKGET